MAKTAMKIKQQRPAKFSTRQRPDPGSEKSILVIDRNVLGNPAFS